MALLFDFVRVLRVLLFEFYNSELAIGIFKSNPVNFYNVKLLALKYYQYDFDVSLQDLKKFFEPVFYFICLREVALNIWLTKKNLLSFYVRYFFFL